MLDAPTPKVLAFFFKEDDDGVADELGVRYTVLRWWYTPDEEEGKDWGVLRPPECSEETLDSLRLMPPGNSGVSPPPAAASCLKMVMVVGWVPPEEPPATLMPFLLPPLDEGVIRRGAGTRACVPAGVDGVDTAFLDAG